MKCHRQYVCLLLQVIFFITNCLAENLILNINVKKPIAVTDHAFLSFTLDPARLQYNDFIKNIEKSMNLARSLAPAYIRLGGPQSNFYNFGHSQEINTDRNDMHFGTQWTIIYQWAKNAGLDVIACITPHYIDKEFKMDSTDPRNIAELLSFSDRMGYNISWQLGYECQTRCDLSGKKLGQYVVNFHEILKTFPRYSNSLITGPDIVAYKTAYQQKYLQDYLYSASAALFAITWHPNLDVVSLNNNSISIHYDNMIAEKNELFKISNNAEQKPLWIAESKSQESKHQYLGALIWMRRLGDAAKLGIQVVMRQLTNLSQATPAYWVSLLYKTLVGREVLELQSNNENYVHFYSHCTKSSALYSKGAVTIFGINLTPKTVTASLKGLKIKILHKYILLPQFETTNKMFSEKVLLNNKPLNLINDKNLPNIYPEIIINPDGLELELPSGGIGFWIIPSAKVKACTCSEEEIIENNTVKKLSKRHENSIQQSNQEEEDINQSNLKNKKVYDNKKQENIKNMKNESQQKVWSSKLLEKIKKFLQKKLQKTDKSESSQRSFTINLEKQENSSEEEQQNLDKKNFKKTEIDNKFKNIQGLLKKYKRILLEKKIVMETRNIQHFKEIKNIDNVMTLISKIDAFILYKIISKEPITSEIEDKTKNEREEESVFKINKKLKEYLSELENSVEIKTNIIIKIKKYFNKLYNLLEYNSTNDNKNNQVHEDLMEQKKFKRHLHKKSENSQKYNILEKRSRINNLKDYAIKQKLQKIKQKNDDNTYNLKRNFINNKNKYNNLQQNPIKRGFKSDAFENANHHIDNQHLVEEYNKIKNDNIYRKHSKIDMEKYQNLIQGSERIKRNIKELIKTDLRRDSASEKHSKDDLTNYVNERKMKKNDIRRELRPFNLRTGSDENDFYGFFQQDPVKGFPEDDIFMTTGDSLEQNDKGYDYVKDKDDSNDSLKKKNTQHSQKSTLDYAKDNTWIEEIKDDHCDYMPNKFFENIKLSNMKIKENFKNYNDLGEAEFLSKVHNNDNNDNDNKIAITEVIKKQPLKKTKRHIEETRIQRLVHHHNDLKKQEYNRDALQSVSRYPSTSFDQFLKIPNSNINYQESNVELKGAKLQIESESKITNSFYPSSEASTVRYNYNDNYQTSNMHYNILKDKNGFDKNIDSNDNINAKASEYFRPSIYAEHSIYNKVFHNKRNKRDNWEKLQQLFVEEMIQEDEENAKDCHYRVIRDSDSPKKHNISVIPIIRVMDISSENKNVSANVTQFQKDLTEEEYQEIMTGEILSSTSDIDSDYEETDATTKPIITELRTLDHKLSETTKPINVTSILGLDNVSKQYHNEKKSTTNLLPVDSDSKRSLNNNNSVKYITKKTFFRTQLPDIQSENKTKTYDSLQIISKIPSENKDPREKFTISTTNNAQKTTLHNQKIQELINKKKTPDNSIYPTITENQNNKKGHNNNCKIELKSTNFLQETTKGIVEQETTETILLKQAANTTNDNIKSNESITKSKLLQNAEGNQSRNKSVWMQLEKDANTRRLKNILRNLPRTEGLTRYETSLTKRTELIDKLKEKLYARREKLLHQNELTKIADEQKRNLKRREIWERLRGSDDFHQLIDPKFIGILLDDDVTYKDDDVTYEDNENDNESCLILIELIPKQYKNIIDQIYLPEKTKKIYYPEYNKYYQVLRNLIDDDEELAETSKSSEFFDREDNQDCRCSSNTIEDEQESTTSRSFNKKIFIIDPSTYYGGEPILQEDNVKLPKYQSKIKSQIQYPRWTLRDIHEILTKLKSSKAQHQVSKSQEYIEKLPIKDYNQEHSNNLHVLDKQRQYDLSKKLAAFAQEWLIFLNQRDVNQASNKEADKLNDVHKNLKADNLNLTFAINKTKFIRSFERNIENKEFDSSNNRKKDIINSETNEDAEDVVKTKKPENIEMIKHEKINKSYSNSNDKTENFNITMFNNNKTVEHVENIIENNPKEKELGKKNSRFRRDLEKQTCTCTDRLVPSLLLTENMKKDLTNMRVDLKEDFIKKIFDTQSMKVYLLTKNNRSNADLFQKLKNYLISSRKDFKVNQQNQKEYDLSYITLTPIEIKNIFEILDTKNNDDSMELFEILQWNDQYVLEAILNKMTEYLNDKISEEFEYEDPSNLQKENSEIFLDKENYINENKQDITAKDSEIESEKDEQYKITNDEINKFLKIKNQIGSKRGMFLLLPWRNVKIRQQRQIKSEINEDLTEIKREVTRQSQPYKSILVEDHENKRIKRYYLNNNTNKEEEENMIETKRVNYLQPQTKNRDNLLEDFIKAYKKNNLYNNEASSIKNETIPLNNISKSDKKILQKEMPKLQNHMESAGEFINDSEENFNDTLANEDNHFRNRTFGTTGNVFYTAIMNIKDFFAFLPKISRIFTNNF